MPNDDRPTPRPPTGTTASVGDDSAATEQLRADFAARTTAAEQLDLTDRADAFSALHDELRTRLETGGTPSA